MMMLRHVVLIAGAGLALAVGCTKGSEETAVGRTDVSEPMATPVTGGVIGRSGEIQGRDNAGMEVKLDDGTGGSGPAAQATEPGAEGSGLAGTGCEEGANAHSGGSLRSNAVHCEGQPAPKTTVDPK